MDILSLILTSLISSGVVGFIFKQYLINSFELKLENHKQELSKELQRHSLFEETKHEVYREYFKLLMIAQSTAILNIKNEEGRKLFNKTKQETYFDLNNYIYSNSLYFSDELYEKIEDLLEMIKGAIMNKEKILMEKRVEEEQLEKDIEIMQEKVKEMRMTLKNELN